MYSKITIFDFYHCKVIIFLKKLPDIRNQIRALKIYDNKTYIVFTSNHNELLVFPLGHRWQFQAVFAHAWYAAYTQ